MKKCFRYIFIILISLILISCTCSLMEDGRPEMAKFKSRTVLLYDKDGNTYAVEYQQGFMYRINPITELKK